MKKKIIPLILIGIMVLFSLSIVFAAPYDLIHRTNTLKNHSFTSFVDSPTVFDEVVADVENYLIESEDGKFYKVEEVSAKVDEGKSFNEAIMELEPVILPGSDEFEVIDIR